MSFGGTGDGSYTQKQLNYILNRQRSLPVIRSVPPHQPVLFYQQEVFDYELNKMGNKSKHATMEIYRPPCLRTSGNVAVAGRMSHMEQFSNYDTEVRNNVALAVNRRMNNNNHNIMQCPKMQCKLNVHAKEFVFASVHANCSEHNKIQPNGAAATTAGINSSGLAMQNDRMYQLRMSKSSGNLTSHSNGSSHMIKSSKNISKQNCPISPTSKSVQFNLQKAKSNENVLTSHQSNNRIKFKESTSDKKTDKMCATKAVKSNSESLQNGALIASSLSSSTFGANSLKRSKSLNAADVMKFLNSDSMVTFTEYSLFPENLHPVIKQAVQDPDELTDRNIMVLARKVLEHVVNNREAAFPASKLSIIIVQKENNGTYLDTMLNTCKLWFQERNKILRTNSANRFPAFVAFLNEFYTQIKRSQLQLKLKFDTMPKLTLLTLLSKCCQDTLQHSEKHSLPEIECLFFVLTSIRRDLANELPESLRQLYVIIRDVLLKNNDNPQVNTTLLQLVELHATEWQLPLSALNYYYYTKPVFK